MTFTMQTLAVKGYSPDFLYGYDWQWRAEETCTSWGKCSAAKWLQAVKCLLPSFSHILWNPQWASSYSARIEAASNFILWLLGKPHNPITIQRRIMERVLYRFDMAPISDMRCYVAPEKKDQKILDQIEYFLEFLSWAQEYWGNELDIRVQEKKSVVRACAGKMNKRVWTACI